jgi:hypothetical protein
MGRRRERHHHSTSDRIGFFPRNANDNHGRFGAGRHHSRHNCPQLAARRLQDFPDVAAGMMITRILVACVLAGVGSLPAFGECFDEAVAARERIWTAGPFRFDSTRWDRNGRTRTCGEIDPGSAQR